jgi:malonyl CoA-acyl carrier protein transacylase
MTQNLKKITTLLELLYLRVQNQPDKCAYTFLVDGDTEEVSLTYAQLDQQARIIAAKLQSTVAVGERALLLYPSGLDYIAAFFGCLYAGVVAVPVYSPRRNRSDQRIQAIATDAGATLILTTSHILSTVAQRLAYSPELKNRQWLTTDTLTNESIHSLQINDIKANNLAFLQYTSGSTGTPKGVMVSHGNLLHNLAYMSSIWQLNLESIMVTWLPIFHDMGLIFGIIQPLYHGATCYLMSSSAFVQSPFRWLQAISRYRATHSGAPNFAYELCVNKITEKQRATLDLSSWEMSLNGAEPVRSETITKFNEYFNPCGLKPTTLCHGYGLAEATLVVGGAEKPALPVYYSIQNVALEQGQVVAVTNPKQKSQTFVGCGHPAVDARVVITNPHTQIPCLANEIGEIWLSSPSVAHGYWQRPAETTDTFQAYLADTGEGPFLRTGDLGFVREDGELFVTGRLKDVIIIRGGNYYPQDIELTVEKSHSALRASGGAAFSVNIAGEEQLVVAQEVERTALKKLPVEEVVGAIRQAVAEQHDLQTYAILLLRTATIPKTSSGKIQRAACKVGFLEKTLETITIWQQNLSTKDFVSHQNREHSNVTAEIIQTWLLTRLATLLNVAVPKLNIQEPFARYGLDSMTAVSLSGELGEWLAHPISPTLLYDYPNIQVLSQYLAGELQPAKVPKLPQIEGQNEAIAVIGMSCRFPGANNLQEFWQLLCNGQDAITEVPLSRWNVDEFYAPNSGISGKMNTRWGGFLDQVTDFDPQFFGISPVEAAQMDPQQRLLLEVSWEALENAGIVLNQLASHQTGVFIGISTNDYAYIQSAQGITATNVYSGTSNAFSIAANRLSYCFDLRGPSIAVDTACSSSLVAIHQACQNLRWGECDLAISGGVNLILIPDLTIALSQTSLMAADGRCKTFDAKADGYVRSEGCGIIILKRLSDALTAGDQILALIKGSAINQDGRTNGLTAPNGLSQQAVVRQALANAGVMPSQISYVEAHGTGTALGDPIEVNALNAVFSAGHTKADPCWVGSVKTNIGHLEAAAGIAGLIKLVLCLQHQEIPQNLHFKEPSHYIDWKNISIKIPTERIAWETKGEPRRGGVSSFGFGGTNAHLVLEEAPLIELSPTSFPQRPLQLLTLSAKTFAALKQLAHRYEEYLKANPDISIGDVCFTANTSRTHFSHRLTVTGAALSEMSDKLAEFRNNQEIKGLSQQTIKTDKKPQIAFLFTGQGTQYMGMGRQLYQTQPLFRKIIDRCDEILRNYLEQPLLEVLYSLPDNQSKLDETAYTQPALFALEYALAALWQSWGIKPAYVIGHSVGEYVAACVAGVFSLEDGLKLIAERARLMQALPSDGKMVTVFASEAIVTTAIQPYTQQVSIAAINGPESMVISGLRAAINTIITTLETKGIKTKPLNVSHAFHSPLMELMQPDFEKVAKEITFSPPQINLISNLTGQLAAAEITTPAYWCRHIRQPVRFATSMETLHQLGGNVFVEIGPKPVLLGMGRQCLPADVGVWLPSLRQGVDDWQQLLQSLGELYIHGASIDWSGFDQDYQRRRVVLPTYPFQRQRYWLNTIKNNYNETKLLSTDSVLKLLQQGETEQLTQQLKATEQFSENEINLLPKLLKVVSQQHQKQITKEAISDWFYQIEWQSKPRQSPFVAENLSASQWLIFADQGGMALALANKLEQQGQHGVLVYKDTVPANASGLTAWQINPLLSTDFEHLLHQVSQYPDLPISHLIHFWSLDIPFTDDLTVSALEQAQHLSCGSVLSLVQTLSQSNQLVFPRLWLVTKGAVPVGHHSLNVAQAPLWGLGKVIALEHPDIWGGMVDLEIPKSNLSETNEDKLLTALLAELWNAEGEDLIALRNGHRYAARLKHCSLPASKSIRLQPDTSYLITGGLGALGLRVAQWLVAQGVRHLILMSRRPPSQPAQETLNQLREEGVDILVANADVANESELATLLETIVNTMPPLRGVVHAAGVVRNEALQDITFDSLQAVLRPKVQGTWLLHQRTQQLSLDFFVCFSSIASIWGSKGQAHYAAANQFLDMLAHYRRQHGLPAMTINWGPWADGGMATSDSQTWLNQMGIAILSPDNNLRAFDYLLGVDECQAVVADVNWTLFKELYNARAQRFLLEKIEVPLSETTKLLLSQEQTQPQIIQQLVQKNAQERQHFLMTYLQSEVAKVLGFKSSQLLEPQQGFFEMGMDSLTAVELMKLLQANLGVPLSATVAFDYPTIQALAVYLMKALGLEITNVDTTTTAVNDIKHFTTDPIAIIGVGCRFPGGVNDPEQFWQLLSDGVDTISTVPMERWDIDAFYDSNQEASGKMYSRYGGFLNYVDHFEPQFFGISPREAVSMDPQQRLLLEVSWEALENAGLVPDELKGSHTGVFVGITANDYAQILMRSDDFHQINPYFVTGNSLNAAAGRLSYILGLQGPSMVIDTACSSSLVAIHLACQSLRSGECNQALVGGVNLILSPGTTIATSQARMLSPDGRCKTFDATANGYVRGEGCGVVILKRFSDAIANGDNILALIRGSAVNQDGASSGFTVPNGQSQQNLIRQALANAKIEPNKVNYVEAHGTGTSLGDPIEVGALGEVLCQKRTQPLLIGSVKTNIGHLESGAGIAALIKSVLAIQYGEIPPHLHLQNPNPHIAWDKLPIVVPILKMRWPSEQRIAGVSAFGFSGTNAHVVLSQTPIEKIQKSVVNPQMERPLHLLTLSAKSEDALEQLVNRYINYIATHKNLAIADLCFTANTGRSHFKHRLSVVAATTAQLSEKLTAFKQVPSSGIFRKQVPDKGLTEVAFLFTGQGSQYVGMGYELYSSQPTFRQTLKQCEKILRPYLEKPLLEVMFSAKNSFLDDTAYAQPALFALEYALAQLWQSWGIKPSVVMGHSVGEYVAACIAEVFSLEDGLRLTAERGRLMQALPQDGQMVAVSVNETRAIAVIQPYKDDISIAAINGPDNVVISGSSQVVETVITQLASAAIKTKKLTVSHAFHSPLMEPMLSEFEQVAREVSYSSPRIALCSNVTGQLIKDEIATPQYWLNHIRQPVQFFRSIKTLQQQGCGLFLEIGPKPTLLGMGRQCLPDEMGVWLPSLRQEQNDWRQLLHSLAELYIHGITVNWRDFDRDYSRRRIILPTYPWQHKRYWITTPANGQPKAVMSSMENTPIINELKQGNTQKLVEQLAKTGQFSTDEQEVLPKFLNVLTHQYQQQIAAASIKDWFYKVEWRTQPRQSLLPDYLHTPQSIHNKLQPYLEELKTRQDLTDYWQVINQLETLSISYVVNAFHKMGWIFTQDQLFLTVDLTTRLGIVNQHQRLLGRLLEMLAEEGILRLLAHQWEVVKVPEHKEPQIQLQSLKTQYPVLETELTMLGRCGEKLAEVLQGKCDPLHELLFPDGNLTTAAKLYQDSFNSQVMNTLVQKTITAALAHLPQDRRLRILEIGAGTGGTTAYILPHLPSQQTDYTFTDLSLLFLNQAKEKFRNYPFIEYQLLDIEQPPDTQKFRYHRYDLILSANVLHATKDLQQTVQHVQQLLMPGGMLVLLENTKRLRFIDLIFGLTEGWWRFTDLHLRPNHPLISTVQWQTLLEENGFQKTAILSTSPKEGGILSKPAVIIAQTAKTQLEQTFAHWLIFADEYGIAQKLRTLLQSRGDACTLVFRGKTYKHLTEKTYQLNPNNLSEFQQLLEEISGETLQGVIHLWSLDAPQANALTTINLEAISQEICGSVLYLIQALLKTGFSKQPQLWLVTQGAVATKNSQMEGIAQSPLWGMGKVIALEHPEFKTVRVDLDYESKPDEAVQTLFEEIYANDETQEDQIAFCNNARYVARLVQHTQTQIPPVTFRDDATYLITGGLGSLGLLVADWMVKKGAKHLVLVGRSAPTFTARQKLTTLEQVKVQVMVLQADISVAEQVSSVLSNIEAMPPLRGIIHAAGVLDDGVLQQQSWARFAKVMAPKVNGAWHLHNLTRHYPLDFLVLFSSATSLLGNGGQANHAAANAFLDALAHYRHTQGLTGLSINWGAWAQIGAAVRHKIDEKNKEVIMMAPQQGLLALEQVFSQTMAQIGIIPIDLWQLSAHRLTLPFFLELSLPTRQIPVKQQINFIKEFNKTPVKKRRTLLIGFVRTQIAKVLGLDSPASIGLQQGFFELGMDSLTSIELRNCLQKDLECTLPSTLGFDYPTTEELVDYLLKKVPTLVMDSNIESGTPLSLKATSEIKLLKNNMDLKNLGELSEDELSVLIDDILVNIEKMQ